MSEITAKTPWENSMGGVPMHLDYFDGSMYEAVALIADKYPNNIAFDFMGRSTTYKTMKGEIERCAKALKTIGVREGERVTIHSMSDGTAFDPSKDYRVAINSYQASGGGDFIPKGLGWDDTTLQSHIVNASPKDVRRYIADHIQQIKVITPRLRGDWQVIPTDWWKKGMETDKKFTNPNQR